MSYSDFTLAEFGRAFSVTVRDGRVFDPVGAIEPSAWLRQAMETGQDFGFTSEKSRSEFIVAPILTACRSVLGHDFRVFSGARLDVDGSRGLVGVCDFILARSLTSFAFRAPLMVILEAKRHDIEDGLGQCAAQMYGTRIYNEREGKLVPHVYGCVTNGEAWQFLKLDGNDLVIHAVRYSLKELASILWFLVHCVQDMDRDPRPQPDSQVLVDRAADS